MADNVAITAGSGTTIATDDVTGVHYQFVKLASGTLDSSQAISHGNGGSSAALRVTLASDGTGVVALAPATATGLTTFHLVSEATTNATNIKASAGAVYGWFIYNSNTSPRKVAFHNTAGSPTAGASVFFTLIIPPTSGANLLAPMGIVFSTGIAITTVTELTDAGNTAVASGDLNINIWYT